MAGWFVQAARPLTFDKMQQSKLLDLLRRLDRRQLTRVGEAVHSPFFNKNEDVSRFFQYLFRFAPSFNQKELDKAAVLRQLNTSRPLDERRLQYLMSDLVTIVEQVLVLDKIERDEAAQMILLAQGLADIGLSDRARHVLARLADFWKKNETRSPEYLAQAFSAAKLSFALADRTHRTFDPDPSLQTASDYLSAFFLVEKLRLMTAMTNLEQMFKLNYQHDWKKEDIESLAAKSDHPLVQPWLLAYRIIQYDRPEDFQSLKEILRSQPDRLAKGGDLGHLTAAALNFCTRRINRDAEEQFYGEYLQLYKLLIDHDLILENAQISPWLYQNLITVGLKTGDLVWTRQFIENFRRYLPDNYADSMYAYNLAHIYYHEQKYKEAQQALAQVEFRDPLLSVSARSLLVKIYLETGQDELLFAALEAARVWLLRNHAVTSGLRRQFQKFVELTGKMARLLPNDHAGPKKLMELLPGPTEVLHRDWLVAQLNKR